MTHLYVCRFSNDHIKVGRSITPRSRIASHADRVACMGVELVDYAIFECAGSSAVAEQRLIEQCREIAVENHQNEWFAGLDYPTACALAETAAAIDAMDEDPVSAVARACEVATSQAELARLLNTSPSMVSQWIKCRRPVAREMAPAIEFVTRGAVSAEELLPHDPWLRIPDITWPHPHGRPVLDFGKHLIPAQEA